MTLRTWLGSIEVIVTANIAQNAWRHHGRVVFWTLCAIAAIGQYVVDYYHCEKERLEEERAA